MNLKKTIIDTKDLFFLILTALSYSLLSPQGKEEIKKEWGYKEREYGE